MAFFRKDQKDLDVLAAQGIRFDIVTAVSEQPVTIDNTQSLVLECLKKRIPSTDLRSHISRRAAIWRTPIADRGSLDKVPASSEFQEMHDILSNHEQEIDSRPSQTVVQTDDGQIEIAFEKSERERFVKPYKQNMEYITAGRRLFTTQTGFVGLGPKEAKANDLVVILFGGHVPFVLRPSHLDGDLTYTLIGEAFVHGIMYGEFIKLFRRQKAPMVKQEQFFIV